MTRPTVPPTRDDALVNAARLLTEAETEAMTGNHEKSDGLREIADGWVDIANVIQDRELHS